MKLHRVVFQRNVSAKKGMTTDWFPVRAIERHLRILEMLYEVTRIQQVPGEPYRRWFFSHEQDLLIWFGDDGKPVAFQLAYGKYRDEHAIRWKVDRGFSHYSVDDGESGPLSSNTPILMADGVFAASRVLERFIELSAKVPREIVEFVAARLRDHPDYHDDTVERRSHLSGAVVIGLVLSLIGAALLIVRPRRRPPGRSSRVDE